MEREPKRWYLRILLSASLIEMERYDEAERLLKEEWDLFADKLSPENILEWKFQQGRIEWAKNNLDSAVKLFDEVRENKPNNISMWENCLDIYLQCKQSEGMYRLLSKTTAIENKRDREWFVSKIGECLAKLSDKPDHETLSLLVKDYPGNCMLSYAIASAFVRGGEIEAARKGFQEIVDSADSYDNIRAASLFRLGLLAEGETRRDFFLCCLQIDPEHSGAKKFLSESE
jgi:tetratricopeptide (TPR) repeat protein